CFQEAYPNMYYNYSNSLNYSSYISELNTLLHGCPELINSHTISYISSLDISETKIKLGQKDETLDKIRRSFFDIAEFQILYSNSMSNGDALEKMNAELLDLGIKNTGLPALNKLKEWQQKRPEAYYSYAKFHNYVTEDYNNNLADYLSIKERYS